MAHANNTIERPKSLIGWLLLLAAIIALVVVLWAAVDPGGFNQFCDWWLSPDWPKFDFHLLDIFG